MQRIKAKGLTKTFKVHRSRPGLKGAFRDLFNREYRTIQAVHDVDLDIKAGEMVGYIGENGAGKSTTIKMLTGILMPTAGELEVNGMMPYKNREAFVRTIGVVFGQRSQLWWDIAVQESFNLLKKVYRVEDDRHLNHMIEVLGVGDFLEQPVRKLSLGQRMRCELIAALIHNPPLVFLDEPTIGLDVLVKLKIREFLKEMNREYGTTIMLTTHDMSDIEALCQRVVVLDKGTVIYDGQLQTLRENWGEGKTAHIEFAKPVQPEALPKQWTWESKNAVQYSALLNGTTVSEFLQHMSQFEIKDLSIDETSTEQIIKKIYEEGVTS
ncbi:ABC transporter ATP-binding protein [Caldalkalibacillus salinus]|uniref:ABC transporter ATP-binding protein n=1 Tax=Caldalkalibacillus salinus TaxID=2803787 RepID=UPI001922CC0A|nr:ATP-binding cassette domain-containing protein [Caldalkalibacillus salinus]